MNVAIEVENLVKKYGNNTVLHQLTFTAMQGEIFALLGANGAGKTTTLECIEGIRSYQEGSIHVHGKIGVQLQSTSLPGSITAIEVYKLFSKWNKIKGDMTLLERFGVSDFKNKQYKSLLTGQKRRLHLAIALVHNPDIIFLDEPTAGLDVEGRVALHNEIRGLKEAGKTIIMASHDMAEVESLCDRIAILREGKLAFLGTAMELTQTYYGESRIIIRTRYPFPTRNLINSKQVKTTENDQNYLAVITEDIGDALLELLTILKELDNDVLDIKIERATLEQRFMEIAKEGR
ncbi:ABC transporter ATP-binding protein [Mobilitalea sibirica]|uniref:ABC transporter ATP-binding protein n=1 Tax=Mobilitalea sibirica TaxID=1462919 RepID=A0A8J7KV54_9FIRM|nr:ABC transporter ATP-binding protein [Mobilitalea sibirica]MBH1939775.1 ABC transporter ATP-binding protein [Mobilitalea sibirica]